MRTGTEIEVRLALIRHGATASNLERRYLGRTDEGLSETGVRQLLLQKEKCKYPPSGYLFSGPGLRCRQTAELLFPGQEICMIREWTEIDFGGFEGKNYQDLDGNEEYQRWIDSGGTLPFPGGEGREEFIARTMRGFEAMCGAFAGSDDRLCGKEGSRSVPGAERERRDAAAVVHGGTIMALCSRLFGGDYFDYQVGNGEGYACRFLCRDQGSAVFEKIQLLELKRL